jgi:hypothetical protein
MSAMSFESFPGLVTSGNATVYEITPPTFAPATIIRRNQAWKVTFDWQTSGVAALFLAGQWKLEIYLEKMGPDEFGLPAGLSTATVPAVATAALHSYAKDIVIPANVVPEGLYKLVVSITHQNPGGSPTPMAGFAEGSLLQFYNV